MAKCSLIIVSYNSNKMITQCLAPVIDSGIFPVTIVDNASTDGSARALEDRFPNARIEALEHNLGYGRAANLGLRKAGTPYAMLLNPDLVATPESIDHLMELAQSAAPETVIIAPAVKEKDHTGTAPEPVKWISGSAMLFHLERMERIGLFDENIFLFSEETDLCRRTIAAGCQILLCHDVFMEHFKGQSTPPNPEIEWMKSWHFGWSHAYYYCKHDMARGKQSPARMHWLYTMKSMAALRRMKRRKYKARAAGVRAFIKGEKAFTPNGDPQASPPV
jgi:N-acetylglucosaminyl-diphospho-decaprenol L-rhamnosyltransferase